MSFFGCFGYLRKIKIIRDRIFKMFIPNYMFDTVYDIPLELFEENGIKYIFFDIDNTLVPYECDVPTKENIELFNRLEEKGIQIIFVSNNNEERVKKYVGESGYKYVANAGKPSIRKYKRLAESIGLKMENCAVVGDQVFTDVVAASKLGIKSFLVKPIKDKTTLFFKTKRWLEKPVIRAYIKRENCLKCERNGEKEQ